MNVSLRFTVVKDKSYVKTPHFKARVTPFEGENGDEYYCTTGVSDGMYHCSI